MISRRLRNTIKSNLHRAFLLGQKLGVDVLPRHFYSTIPDVNELKRTDWWRKPWSMAGVSGSDVSMQMQFVKRCCVDMRERLLRGDIFDHACHENGEIGFGPTEADFLYCFIASKRPKKIVQVGAGVSTAVILLAAEESDYRPEVVCVDPFPTRYLRELGAGGRIKLVHEMAQKVDVGVFTQLGSGDLLFVDSTHTVRPGSEVNRIILEVLPGLAGGCYVHFHDIYFPYDYQPGILDSLFFGGESTLLHAFLVNNSRFEIAASLSMLHHAVPTELRSELPNYRPAAMNGGLHVAQSGGHFPTSTYLLVR